MQALSDVPTKSAPSSPPTPHTSFPTVRRRSVSMSRTSRSVCSIDGRFCPWSRAKSSILRASASTESSISSFNAIWNPPSPARLLRLVVLHPLLDLLLGRLVLLARFRDAFRGAEDRHVRSCEERVHRVDDAGILGV